ncbi:helix-turn-helix domain containing protein [Asanoa sp. WMMD1127]|uniref:TetR/AcrR family transcriptional regulator n=1 Tax=Asanoa sp. WMMD1127 TaxID=3016107 RepID=UPI002415BD7A|nr:TetR/AcrR family transcriptional regulator [Asanoa sp. WMMD1127]MDG4822704.1 helix-turn-helix domain containing protein [Asanoa sp. WMMD1127]
MGTRDVILDAAAEVIRSRGMANATTREIAKAAGYSEATLYKHFTGKVELLVEVLRERSPGLARLNRALAVLDDDLPTGLTAIATAAIAFYTEAFPMLASIFGDPSILAAHTAGLRQVGAGPHRVNEAVVDYLRLQQDRGAVRPDADLVAAAALLVGACFQHAFLGHMNGPARRPDPEAARSFATLVATALR